jgi:hypothetical protein
MSLASQRLRAEWAVCAIAAAASRFIPVPLLDDAVKSRATQVAVVRTLRANGRDYSADAVAPLYEGVETWAGGAFRYMRSVPRRVVLFPVRKYVALFGAVTGVPTDVMIVLLLARTTQRCLAAGRLTGPDEKAVERESVAIRRAFDATLAEMDLRLFTGALSDSLSRSRGLAVAATRYARRVFGRRRPNADAGMAADLDPGGEVGQGARRVESVLERPDIVKLLEEFDARLDARLARS